MTARAFVGAGDVYINRIDPASGLAIGKKGPFEASRFAIKANSEIKEQVSKGRSTYGQVIETVALGQPAEFEITLTETNRDGMAMALLGTASTLSQGSGTITDEVIVGKHGIWVPTSKSAFASAGFSVKHSSGSPTYVEGTDYEVNRQLGWVRLLSTGAIADGASIKVSGSYQTITGSRISGATQAQVRAEILLDGINVADNNPVVVTIYEAVLSAGDVFDFLADGFNSIPLKGKAKTPSGQSAPFIVDLRGVTA